MRAAAAQPAVKLAFLVFTGARSEIDAAGRVWTISAARMKAKRPHRVPLCRRALEILNAARKLGDGKPLAFSMRSARPISMSTLTKMLQYHGIAAVAAPVVVPGLGGRGD